MRPLKFPHLLQRGVQLFSQQKVVDVDALELKHDILSAVVHEYWGDRRARLRRSPR